MFQHHKKHYVSKKQGKSLKFYVAFSLPGKESLETVLSSQGLEFGSGSPVPKEAAHKKTLVNCLLLLTYLFYKGVPDAYRKSP